MATTPTYPASPNSGPVTVVNADGTAKKTLYTAGASGSRIHAINIATDDTAAHDVQIWLTISAVDYLIGTVSVPAGSGNTSGVAQVNVLALLGSVLDPAGYLVLKASAIIKIACPVAVTAAKTLYAEALGADF